MKRKISRTPIEERFIQNGYALVGEYKTQKTPTIVRCLKCGREATYRPDYIFAGKYGCKGCAGQVLTSEEINSRFEFCGFRLLGIYSNSDTSIMTECINCGVQKKLKPSRILEKRCKCEECASRANTPKKIIANYTKLNLKLVEEYKNSTTRTLTKCTVCKYQWSPIPSSITRGHGCPKCAGQVLDLHEIKKRYTDKGFMLVGEYVNAKTKTLTECCQCHHQWSPRPEYIFHRGGCPECNTSGYKISLPAGLYVLQITGEDGKFVGFGISNKVHKRIKTHRTVLKNNGYKIISEIIFPFSSGKDALDMETLIKQTFEIINFGIPGFKKEAVHFDKFEELVTYIRNSSK